MKYKIFSFVIVFVLLISYACPIASYAADNEVVEPAVKYAEHYAVYNIENDMYCYQKGIDETVPAAGNAKIMTACIAIEHYRSGYDKVITVEEEWLSPVSGHTIGYRPGEEVSVDDLLAGLIVSCANDSA